MSCAAAGTAVTCEGNLCAHPHDSVAALKSLRRSLTKRTLFVPAGSTHAATRDLNPRQPQSQQLKLQHRHLTVHLQQQPSTFDSAQSLESAQKLITARTSRSLLEPGQPPSWKPSRDETERAKSAGHFSASHALFVLFMCVIAMILLGYSGYKAMKWLERIRRPGYVELQSLDTAYHRPAGH